MAAATITVLKKGPFVVMGDVELKDAEGNLYPTAEKLVLCRCGASEKKPFCDGTHGKIGFAAAESAVPASAEASGSD